MIKRLLVTLLTLVAFTSVALAAPRSASSARVLFSSTSLTVSGAYAQLFSSLPKSTKALSVYNTCSNPVFLAVGASGSEAVQTLVSPLTASQAPVIYPMVISQGQRVSAIASVGTCSSGELTINAFYN